MGHLGYRDIGSHSERFWDIVHMDIHMHNVPLGQMGHHRDKWDILRHSQKVLGYSRHGTCKGTNGTSSDIPEKSWDIVDMGHSISQDILGTNGTSCDIPERSWDIGHFGDKWDIPADGTS